MTRAERNLWLRSFLDEFKEEHGRFPTTGEVRRAQIAADGNKWRVAVAMLGAAVVQQRLERVLLESACIIVPVITEAEARRRAAAGFYFPDYPERTKDDALLNDIYNRESRGGPNTEGGE